MFTISMGQILPKNGLRPSLVYPPNIRHSFHGTRKAIQYHLRSTMFRRNFPRPLTKTLCQGSPTLPTILRRVIPRSTLKQRLFIQPTYSRNPMYFGGTKLYQYAKTDLYSTIRGNVDLLTLHRLLYRDHYNSKYSNVSRRPQGTNIRPISSPGMYVQPTPPLTRNDKRTLLTNRPNKLIRRRGNDVFMRGIRDLPSSGGTLDLDAPTVILPSLVSPHVAVS